MSEGKDHQISLPGEWALKKVLGPTFEELGKDISTLYKLGVDKIVKSAERKTPNIDDGAKANLRVSRDVFFNGAFSDDLINAEYFGGVLAASRSSDGKDDKAIFFLDIIKSLSSSQLLFHHIIYSSLNKLMIQNDEKNDFNPASSERVGRVQVFFLTNDLNRLGVNVDADFLALNSKGLIGDYEYSADIDPEKIIHICYVRPTPLGIQLYAISSNRFEDWRKFALLDLDTFQNAKRPAIASDSLEELLDFEPVKDARQRKKLETAEPQ